MNESEEPFLQDSTEIIATPEEELQQPQTYNVPELVLTTKFDMFGQKSAAKNYGILEFVRDKCRVRQGHILYLGIKSTSTLTNLKARFWTCNKVKQIFQASVCFSHQQQEAQQEPQVQNVLNEEAPRRSERVRRSAIRDDYEVHNIEESHMEDDPTSYEEAMRSARSSEWLEAMKDEMKSMKINDVWDLEELPKGTKIVGCKWVYKTKYDSRGNTEKFKARLVAKGFMQRERIDYNETFSPVSWLLGRFQSNSGPEHWKLVKKVLRYLQGGAISWKSFKQTITAGSTMYAEFIACYEATGQVNWLKMFVSSLKVVDSIEKPLKLYCDNEPAVIYAHNNQSSGAAKHIDMKYYVVKDKVRDQTINLEHIRTKRMVVDPLTKGLPPNVSKEHVAGIGLREAL
uniref:Transposon protein, putative, unclassified n=1 Tax=Oryza sativa subsp. japonica TaxID=39947 RepID=Q2QT05_ORYSJ|nr:transposon protein, putative, unclassified [Oryza sativa Japonica Group]